MDPLKTIQQLKRDVYIWIILFCIIISPIGLGYFIDGFFNGFKALGIEHILLGTFLAIPFMIISFANTNKQEQIFYYKMAIKNNMLLTKKEINKMNNKIILGTFMGQAIYSWLVEFCLGAFWLISGRQNLTPPSSLSVYIFLGLVCVLLVYTGLMRYDKEFNKVYNAYDAMRSTQEAPHSENKTRDENQD